MILHSPIHVVHVAKDVARVDENVSYETHGNGLRAIPIGRESCDALADIPKSKQGEVKGSRLGI